MKNIKTLIALVILVFVSQNNNAQTCSSFALQINSNVNSTNLLSTILTGSSISNKQVNLNATLTVVANLTISASTFEMGPNAKIIVNGNCSLTITSGSWMRSCNSTGSMWSGIELIGNAIQSPSTIVINGNSIIEDAEDAILVMDGGIGNHRKVNLNINGAIFNRNFNSIRIEDPSGSAPALMSLIIVNTKFYCRSVWNTNSPGNVLHSPHTGARTANHVYFNHATINAPGSTLTLGSNTNNVVFENANKAINLYHTALIIDHITSTKTNWHIYDAFDGYLTVKNSVFSAATTAGIEVMNFIDTEIKENTFTGDARAIYLKNSLISVKVYDNTITNATNTSIYAASCYVPVNSTSVFDIYNNNITTTTTTTSGIYVSETNTLPSGSKYKIRDNPTISGGAKGIELINIKNVMVYNNPAINISGVNNGFGIKATNCANAQILNNKITGNSSTVCTNNTVGIITENSSGTQVNCNTVNMVNLGVRFTGTTLVTSFLNNTMKKSKYQFYLLNNAQGLGTVGGSSASLNYFTPTGNCEPHSSTYSNASNTGTGFTKFRYMSVTGSPNINTVIIPNNGAQVCTKQQVGTFPLSINCGPTTGGGNGNGGTAGLIPLVDGTYEWTDDERAAEQMAKEYVYYQIEDNQDYLQEPVLAAFYEEFINTPQGELLFLKDSMVTDTTAIDSLLIENATIATGNVPEENYQIVNEMLLIARGENFVGYDMAQLQLLDNIAQQCPLTGGVAVYLARAELANARGEVAEYENDCESYQPEARRAKEEKEKSSAKLLVANDWLSISTTETILSITVFNTYGQKVIAAENVNSINLGVLTEGAYIVKVTMDKDVHSCKIVLVK